jgi:predicted acetyltransferase
VSVEVRACSSVEEVRRGVNAISHYFGADMGEEDAERFVALMPVDRMFAAFDGDRVVGGAGSFPFSLSVPGGDVPAAGVTVVGVLPTDRRRGVLTQMTRTQLADCRGRNEPLAVLWASEAAIYGRFGYGFASRIGQMTLAKERTAFSAPHEPRGTIRLVSLEEALEAFPPLYERVRRQRAGMTSRTRAWWETRRLVDGLFAGKGGPKRLALLELDGAPAGYAVYKVLQDWQLGVSSGSVQIVEALAVTPQATKELWRWLLDFDWTAEFKANLPLDHPLFLLLAEPRRMQLTVGDALWLRLLDIPAAMAARSFAGDGEVVVELTDPLLPENAGRWRIGAAGAERVDAPAAIALDVAGLGSVYLGGFSFADLVRAARAEELVPGAVERADALFRTDAEPWCPEIF